MGDLEMNRMMKNENNNGSNNEQATPRNREGSANSNSYATERDSMMKPGSNGSYSPPGETPKMSNLRREMTGIICWKIKVWMPIAAFLLLIIFISIILISMAICAALREDVDDRFDSSLFNRSLYFNGSFQLPNADFSEQPFTLSSNDSQTLAAQLEEKLSVVYRSSPALGRYFAEATIHDFRNDTAGVQYQLRFIYPQEDSDVGRFTLSREVVYNVLRQALYDQEPDDAGHTHIDPLSLRMLQMD